MEIAVDIWCSSSAASRASCISLVDQDLIGSHLQRNASENAADWLKNVCLRTLPAATGAAAATLEETAMPFFQKGDVRIRYEEAGSGFPLLVTPGGGLNSRVSNWPTAVINAMEEFKNDFRCITMDQRNANGGESSGPVQVDNPWDAFADDQLGLMDHLGIREFLYGLLHRRLLCREAAAAGPQPGRRRRVLPERRPSAGKPDRHVPP